MYIANLRLIEAARRESDPKLRIAVLFTDVPSTLEALRRATKLVAGLDAEIELLAPEEVPFPLPLEQHPVRQEYTAKRLRAIAGRFCVPLCIHMIYCRDRAEAIRRCLRPESPLVVAWKKRWIFDGTARLVRNLRGEGYQVVTPNDGKGSTNVGSVLYRCVRDVLRSVLGNNQGLRPAVRS